MQKKSEMQKNTVSIGGSVAFHVYFVPHDQETSNTHIDHSG